MGFVKQAFFYVVFCSLWGCVRLSARLPLRKGLRLVHKRSEGEVAAAGAPATAPALALSPRLAPMKGVKRSLVDWLEGLLSIT
jgi:hypothetical protein